VETVPRAGDRVTLAIDRPIVLVAEDDLELRLLILQGLRAHGYRVCEARDGSEALQCLERLIRTPRLPIGPDLVISDVRMPGFSGLQVLEAARRIDSGLPVILITAFGDERTHSIAQKLRADAIFDKPFELRALIDTARRLVPWK
jgi:DNA-binding response OmpR family regulator